MNIVPQDLGPENCAQMLRLRGLVSDQPGSIAAAVTAGKRKAESFALLGGLFGFSVGLVTSLQFHDLSWAANWVCAGLGVIIGFATTYAGSSHAERRWRENRRRQALTAQEINHVSSKATDGLSREYIAVAGALLSLPPPGDEAVSRNIRHALRRLGEAVESLPAQPAANVFADPIALRDEARRLTSEGQGESDAVVASSLQRQAAALTGRAQTITRTAVLLRRNEVLRAEVAAQIRAFQTSLAAAQVGGRQGGADFAALAEQICLVAQEADALVEARAELDAAQTSASGGAFNTLETAVKANASSLHTSQNCENELRARL